jgi:hypothetical protein
MHQRMHLPAVIQQRDRVVEHRFTTYHRGVRVRYWLESDPEFGGAHRQEAHRAIEAAEAEIGDWHRDLRKLVLYLLEKIRSANSIEACDRHGNGFTAHRDWP